MCTVVTNAFVSLDPNLRAAGIPEEDRTGESLPHMRAPEAGEGRATSSYAFGRGRGAASALRAGYRDPACVPGDDGYDAACAISRL